MKGSALGVRWFADCADNLALNVRPWRGGGGQGYLSWSSRIADNVWRVLMITGQSYRAHSCMEIERDPKRRGVLLKDFWAVSSEKLNFYAFISRCLDT